MSFSTYATESQYIEPQNLKINPPSPPIMETNPPPRMPPYIDPLLADFLQGQINPMIERFEEEKHKIRIRRTAAYYLAYFIMVMIGIAYIYHFSRVFTLDFKK